MKIALVTYSLMIGGIERVIFNQAKLFQEAGNQVIVVETQKKGLWNSYFLESGIDVKTFQLSPWVSKVGHTKKLIQFLKDYDVIFIHDSPFVQAGISTLPDTIFIFPVLHSILDSMLDNATANLSAVNKIITVSPYLKTLLEEKRNVPSEKIQCIPTSVIKESGICTKQKTKVGKKFIYLGRLEHTEKAVLILPDIIQKVMQHAEIDCLHIYGDGSDKVELESKIQDYGLGEIIKVKGYLPYDNLYQTLQQYDFMILPSFFEGQGLVALEAMAQGVIPVVSRLEGRTEAWIEHGKSGFLCIPGDPDDFSKVIIDMLQRSDLHLISENGKNVVRTGFTLEHMKSAYEELIRIAQVKELPTLRDQNIDFQLLGDLPRIPYLMVRPFRKSLKLLGLWK